MNLIIYIYITLTSYSSSFSWCPFFSPVTVSFYFSSMAKLRFVNCCSNKRIWMNKWMLFYYDIYCCSHLRHINRRLVWAGHLYTRCCSLCGRAAPHLSLHRLTAYHLHRLSPSVTGYERCRPVWSRDGESQSWGSFDVAAAALAAERNANKRYQLIGRVRSRRHRHPVIMSVHLQSSDVSTSGLH